MKIPNAEQTYVDIHKITAYVLNPEHPYGKDKAIVFRSALGITIEHAELLRAALITAARNNEVVIGQQNEFGQRYQIDFEMIGPNGQTARLRSGWIIRSDEDFPRLATVYVI